MLSFSETHCRENLFPFTLTRHTADIRTGIFTIREKWEMAAALFTGLHLPDHIPANIVPGPVFFKAIAEQGSDQAILQPALFKTITYPWQLPAINEWAMLQDFELVKMAGRSCSISPTNKISGDPDLIFIEEGAVVEHCFLNTSMGPIYIGRNAGLMEGSMLRGPVSIGEGSVVKMGAAIYGATTIGPGCVVGGEIKNSIFFSFSNKAHEGYIGDAVIGSWCNLGAGTSCSNIRNTATPVKVWNMHQHCFLEAGLKCGLLMGDYSRCGINTSFNTGTVVGVSANIFQSGSLQPKFIPSFSWGSDTGIRYHFDKAVSDINNWMAFRQRSLTEQEKEQLKNIYSNTEKS
jgi:UDP-N-acetylglucosamine diphosphorylase / glucose-1-phosphate thymidylyltransferase / UDP-N-acetylgalactosamine diphosphorylase / glucosamine-1-phosphate N-acetyltransferase / galactosamine-1-phosphate N-acetyltransferase